MIAELDQDANVVLEDDKKVVDEAKEVAKDAKVDDSADIQGRTAESRQKSIRLIWIMLIKVTVAPSRRRKGVVIRDLQEESTTSTIIPAETKSKDKGKGILAEEPKPLKKKQQIKQDEQYARELQAELNKNIDWDEVIDHVKIQAKEDPTVKKYQALKRKPLTEAQARKNMMLYLKNVAGFKMDYFKGMSYDDIRPIFEAKFNSNVAFLLKTKEQKEEDENRALKRLNETPTEGAAKKQKLDEEVEELKRHLQIVPNEDDDVYTEATPLAQKVLVVDYQIIELNNKPYYKIIRAYDTHQLYKNQKSVHGPAKVKGWKLLESCGVQIITFTTTQLIFLVEKKYPLIRFTLDQMLNAVRLEVEEESKVSLELLSEIITTASINITAAEAQVPAVTLIAAPVRVVVAPSRRRKGVVIRDPKEESTTFTIIPAETKSKDKELEAELNKNIDWDEAIDHVKRKAKEMDYFKGMSYDDIRPIFEAKFNTNVAFLLKTKEQIEEEESRALKRINETPVEKAAKRKKLDEELILLVEKKYPLTRFTLDQMLNAVRLEVEEESEVSLELLREAMQTTQDLEEPASQEFETGATDDQPVEEASRHPHCNLAKKDDSRTSFNELMDTPVNFSAFMMNRIKVDTLTPKLLVGPTYELMKGSCKSLVELEFFLEEVYKETTDQLDWNNPEG
nr:hypothetical protein [Tanacetum cinerariifolium]